MYRFKIQKITFNYTPNLCFSKHIFKLLKGKIDFIFLKLQ